MLTSIMGIEGKFLLRIGDAGIPQNQLQVATSSGNVTDESLAIPTNEWTHIAVTYDADAKTVIVYINGKNMLETTLDCGAVNWGQTMTEKVTDSGLVIHTIVTAGWKVTSQRYVSGTRC